jgi:hypothetical protein
VARGAKKRRWPGTIVLVLLVLVVLSATAAFAYRPAVILGVKPKALADSLARETGEETGAHDACDRIEGERWVCEVADDDVSGAVKYRLRVRSSGCWDARLIGRRPSRSTPAEHAGCISIFDYADVSG